MADGLAEFRLPAVFWGKLVVASSPGMVMGDERLALAPRRERAPQLTKTMESQIDHDDIAGAVDPAAPCSGFCDAPQLLREGNHLRCRVATLEANNTALKALAWLLGVLLAVAVGFLLY